MAIMQCANGSGIISYEVQTPRYSVSHKQVKAVLVAICRSLDLSHASLNIQFVSDQKMIAHNKRFFKRVGSTDVISFPWKSDASDQTMRHFIGDSIVCLDRARYQARAFQTSLADECVMYLVHGILHLIGYEDTTPRKKKTMFHKQHEVMDTLKKKKVYDSRIVKGAS